MRGLGDNTKRRKLFYYLNMKKYDIIFLQETHSTGICENQWKNEWGGKIWFDYSSARDKGVAILIRKNFSVKVFEVYRSNLFPGRFVALKVEIEGEILLLANIYALNLDSPQFFDIIFQKMEQTGLDRKIVGGDFNLVLNQQLDRKGKGTHKNMKVTKRVVDWIENLGLVDIWRAKQDRPGFTWARKYLYPIFERLDFLFSG